MKKTIAVCGLLCLITSLLIAFPLSVDASEVHYYEDVESFQVDYVATYLDESEAVLLTLECKNPFNTPLHMKLVQFLFFDGDDLLLIEEPLEFGFLESSYIFIPPDGSGYFTEVFRMDKSKYEKIQRVAVSQIAVFDSSAAMQYTELRTLVIDDIPVLESLNYGNVGENRSGAIVENATGRPVAVPTLRILYTNSEGKVMAVTYDRPASYSTIPDQASIVLYQPSIMGAENWFYSMSFQDMLFDVHYDAYGFHLKASAEYE